MAQQVRCYEYVNRPYPEVHAALAKSALEIFQRATRTAAERASAIGAELHAKVGAIEVGRDVDIQVTSVEETKLYGSPATQVRLTWSATKHAGLFPTMTATLNAFALSKGETQLELDGTYEPPLGVVGQALDAMALHRIAEASVLRFVQDIAGFLRAG
jgi:hypothetical protein